MAIPTEKAYELLNLPLGASKDAIEQSYKKLAFKWHPEKYSTTKNTQEALKKFKQINIAYRKLIFNERDDKDITLHEMFEQYRQVFHSENNKKKEKLLSIGQTFVDIKNSTDNNLNILNNKKSNSLLELNSNNNFMSINKKLSASKSGTNANQFFGNELNLNLIKNTKLKLINNDKNNNNDEENYENQYQMLRKDDQTDQIQLAIKLKVKSLAMKGNDLAKQNEFTKAIEMFTEAIKHDYKDHRLYGNRSYCYDKICLYQEALNDAEKAIYLEPLWPKGYFRKGRALSGLKMYKEAEQAYEKVLESENTDDPELEEELQKVRSLQLQEMGFSKAQSDNAIKNCATVQAALESIFYYPKTDKSNESSSDVDENDLEYNENDSENDNENNLMVLNKKTKNKLKLVTNRNKTDNKNSLSKNFNSSSSSSTSSSCNNNSHDEKSNSEQASTSLWIGNVDPGVTEDMLIEMFSNFGQLANVRCLPEKYCAFVNFKNKEDAQKAMNNLQGKLLEGQRLLIKYPDNPNTVLLSSLVTKSQKISISSDSSCKKVTGQQEVITKLKKKESASELPSNNKTIINNAELNQYGMKLSGPVNGNECYFWRTTGCLYADKCRYEHIKKNKGIDKKPWHK